jgi:hypothetical protein
MPISASDLNAWLGKSIGGICGNSYANPNDNHCAHFVSHAMKYEFGYNCKVAGSGKAPGANIRVQELFARCPAVGAWTGRPASLNPCLVFVTSAHNVHLGTKIMNNVPQKHIGIFLNGTIWHYSNAHHKVVTQLPEEFVHHYHGPDIALFYGQFPA